MIMNNKNTPVFESTEYTLYYNMSCPFCIKVVLALKRLNIKINMNNTNKNSAYSDILFKNTNRYTVPCLNITKNNTNIWMHESADIIKYLKTNLK